MSNNSYDIIIAGGGITGAGIFKELSYSGLKVCIIEKNDFGSGTSSKSSKLVHGGLRYLKQGNLMLTFESVLHRQRLLSEAPGLVESIEFMMPIYKNQSPGKLSLGAGLAIYDLMALKNQHSYICKNQLLKKINFIKQENLSGAYSFHDASTDDSALVAKLIKESINRKNMDFKNYCEITSVENHKKDGLNFVNIKEENGNIKQLKTKLLINATGAWAENLHVLPKKNSFIRPLKGSHLVIKNDILNLKSAVSFSHPKDKRPVFAIPWEGVLLIGTTDIDAKSMQDLKISKTEINYLLEAINNYFPKANIHNKDIISTFSGIRPVISNGKKDPSKESREHFVWEKKGIISVTGGKLTTFRKLAWDTLAKAQKYFPDNKLIHKKKPVFINKKQYKNETEKRLFGRYIDADLQYYKKNRLLEKIPGTNTYWAEIDLASKDSTIKHLDDLLLRRLSLGMILENGAMGIIDSVKKLSSKNLGWDEEKWDFEIERYTDIYHKFFSPEIKS